jgi:hypothetical protein
MDGLFVPVDGQALELEMLVPTLRGFKFFMYQSVSHGVETWVVSEVITGAKIAEGLTKPEAIGAAVIKLSANGRKVLVEKVRGFTQKYGRTIDGQKMTIPNAS